MGFFMGIAHYLAPGSLNVSLLKERSFKVNLTSCLDGPRIQFFGTRGFGTRNCRVGVGEVDIC